jgi:hypothetical protein
MTKRADQRICINAPAHSAALMQAFSGKASHQPVLSAPLKPRYGSLRLLAFPKAKIGVETEVICERYGHAEHKLSQRRLTAD